MTTIACVIPAYNEERFIAGVIQSVPAFVHQIIVVNDASRDGTARVVDSLNDPRVVLINHDRNTGVGGAVASGYKAALELAADIVVKLDGDGQMNSADMRKLIGPILKGRADYAKGVRFRDAEVIRHMPFVRFIGNLGLSFLTKIASGYWDIFDPTNGFTAIERTALESLKLEKLSRDYFFETDMLLQLYRISAVVEDVEMKASYGDEESHLSPMKVFFTFPARLFKGLCKRIIWRYFIRDFTAFSAFFSSGVVLFGFGLIFGLYRWILNSFVLRIPSPLGTIMLAAVPLILGFQLLLQAAVLDIHNVPTIPLQRNEDEGEFRD